MSQEVANYFVRQSRTNMHKAGDSKEEDKHLIYNWLPTYTGGRGVDGQPESAFEQAYFFPPAASLRDQEGGQEGVASH